MNYGSHSDACPVMPFFTAAAAIGQTREQIDLFIARLDEAFTKFRTTSKVDILKEHEALAAMEG